MQRKISLFLLAMAVLLSAGLSGDHPALAAPLDTTADRVFGQGGSFASSTCNLSGLSSSSLCLPSGVVADSSGNVYIADTGNNRVLEYTNPTGTDQIADRVFGQPNFTSAACNQGGSPSDSTLCSPAAVAVDSSNNLYVADGGNHRVLKYQTPLANQVADLVVGQPGFTTGDVNHGGLSASSLKGPQGVWVDPAGKLWVGDSGNNRVLEYNAPLTDTTADTVFGQSGSFLTNSCMTVSASSLCGPNEVEIDSGGRLWVANFTENRVLEYNAPLSDDVADTVFGQNGSFSTSGCKTRSASSLCAPAGLAVDNAHAYVAEFRIADIRVVQYDAPLANQVGDKVFGQPDFVTSGCNIVVSANTLCVPLGVALDGAHNLYIADTGINRVLEYDSPKHAGGGVGGITELARVTSSSDGGSAWPFAVLAMTVIGALGLSGAALYARRRVAR